MRKLWMWTVVGVCAGLSACGNSGPSGATASRATQNGVFVDAPVQGLAFSTASLSGVTDVAGRFTYRGGETMSFFIGPLLLGTAAGQPLISPLTLVSGATGVTDKRVTNIAVLLQSLDADRNPDNGITVPEAAAAAVAAHVLDLDLPSDQFQQSTALLNAIRQANGDHRTPVTVEDAQQHLQKTLDDANPPAALERIIVQAPMAILVVGNEQQYTATGEFDDGTTRTLSNVTWTSSNPNVASITSAGLLKALAPGSTTITATREGVTGNASLTVNPVPRVLPVFKVGTGQGDHNPKSRVCIGGGGTNCSRAAGPGDIRDPLIARAMAITGENNETFIVVTTTNIGYFLAYKPEVGGLNGIYDVRLRIARETGVPSTHITVVSDHSHNGPDTIGIWGGVSAEYLKITADAVVNAAVQAFQSRRDAHLHVAAINGNASRVTGIRELDSSYNLPPGNDLARGNPYNEFRMLVAQAVGDGPRLLTFVNYAPHATVTNGDRIEGRYMLTGDWTAWAPDEARKLFGGEGVAAVGALGATDWNKSGDVAQKEVEARDRLRKLMQAADQVLQPVEGGTVQVESVFIREAMAQPILLLNYKPGVDRNDPSVPTDGVDVRIDRAIHPPFLTGTVVGTYVSAVRIGDVFLSTFPGEPFGELNQALKEERRVEGAKVQFLLGGANDFFGYMVKHRDSYEQTLRTGLLYLGGCPEEDFAKQIGLREEGEDACADHWTLMVSPTIGSHIICTLQNSAERLGFTVGTRDPECPVLTALDGQAAPPESDSPLAGPLADGREAAVEQARALAQQCASLGAALPVCMALNEGARQAEIHLGTKPSTPAPVPTGPARAGVASKDASWHLGASAGQFAASGAGVARDAGFDPYGHSTRKVGSDILGTRIVTRALVVEGANGERVAVVANDLYLPNDLLQRRTAQKLAEHDRLVGLGLKSGPLTGITGSNLAMTSSHSHTSPFYSTPSWGTWIFQDVFDLRFYEYMATQQSEAIIEAAASLKPVRMGGVTVRANDVQGHTYGPKGPPNDSRDGTPAGQPYDYTTQQVTVIRFDELDGKPLANWVIFGVHPEWVWGEEIVNGDLTHQVMKLLDRETGALTVWSQNETGSSGPHKDTRVHAPQARREFQESNFSGAERAARLLTDSIKRGLAALASGNRHAPGIEQFSAYRTGFPVQSASQRFAPPATRPYPGVSNCNSSRVLEGDVGIPILGFPDCFYDHTEFTDVVTEPFLAALPYSPTALRDQLLAAGVPVPTSYSATTLTAVEETAAVHLMVFKLGGIVATLSPSEQFTSGALNLQSRLDRIPGNLWNGYDWVCLAEARGQYPQSTDANVRRHCAQQNARYPEHRTDGYPVVIPGSLDNGLGQIDRIRAQIHNDARGWELDPVYMFNQQDPAPLFNLGSESEPADVAGIKGNFTHEEFTPFGYELVATVGMVNDYWGYMPEYRDYRSFDHYRKALNGLGPHGADFLNTRLARMAANLNGAGVTLPTNPLDAPFQAESARAEATAQMLGELARGYTALYDTTVPADGGTARITQEPGFVASPLALPQIRRFSAAVMTFVGGSNYSGSPQVRVERKVDGQWRTYGTQEGEVQLQLKFLPSLGATPSVEIPLLGEGVGAAVPDPAAYATWRAGLFEWEWTASFEAFVSDLETLGDRPRVTPEGEYRFVVDGFRREWGGALQPYHLESRSFEVVPWNGITVEGLRIDADRTVSFAVGPYTEHRRFRDGMGTEAGFYDAPAAEAAYAVGPVDYPDSYSGGISWIRNERQLNRDGARDSGGHQQYCSRCSFRPWADGAEVASATVTVRRADGSTYPLQAQRQGLRWVTQGSVAAGETAYVAAAGIVDQYGERNGQQSVEVSVPGAGNHAPVANAGNDFTIEKSKGATLNGWASFDPDRDALTYAWTQVSGAAVVLSGAATARPAFVTPATVGALVFNLRVTDAAGLSHDDAITVTVTEGGTPPGPAPFDLCDPISGDYCLRDLPVIGAVLADALGTLFGEAPVPGVPEAGAVPGTDAVLNASQSVARLEMSSARFL